MLDLIAVLVVFTALAAYLNFRLLRLPFAIGVMSLTIAASFLIMLAGRFYPGIPQHAASFVRELDFNNAVLHGMLGFLLFAGALHIKLEELARWRLTIVMLATVGIILSTAIVASAVWLALWALGIGMSFINCLLFGALISPTDPVAVLGVLKQARIPKPIEVTIAGESLFNDGVGVVVFLTLLEIAVGKLEFSVGHVALMFAREAVGGAVFGLAIGLAVYWLLKSIDNYQVEVLITLALVAGGYRAAEHLGISAPIAIVAAGLLIGNQGRRLAMSPRTVQNLDLFWEIIDELLNGILFVLIGLEVLVIDFQSVYVIAGALAVVTALVARLLSLLVPAAVVKFRPSRSLGKGALLTLTWGGLRGGLSVAMALSIPASAGNEVASHRDVILVMTYAVVVFSVLVQGLTLGPLARRWCNVNREPRKAA